MKTELVKLSKVKKNPSNPRIIKDEKFLKLVESIKEFPQMLEIRPIVVNQEMVVLGGNMRLKACKEAGLKEIPIIHATDLSEEQQRQFIIKDNVGFGEWEWDLLLKDFTLEELESWGLDSPGFDVDGDEFGDEFSLEDGAKTPIQQMTFILADEQAGQIRNALDDIKGLEEFKYVETMGNENGNGNALYLLIMQWAEQRR